MDILGCFIPSPSHPVPRSRGRVSSHLSVCLALDKLLKDPVGFGGQLGFGAGLLEVLAGQSEVQVLLTELSLQESTESSQPICKGCKGSYSGRRKQAGNSPTASLHPLLPN